MLDDISQATLLSLYRRESRTFLQYVHDSSPWVAMIDQPLALKLKELAEAEAKSLNEVSVFLDSNRIALPYFGTYPTRFTAYNFTNVRKLIPLIIQDHQSHLKSLLEDRNRLTTNARVLVEKLIELRQNHLVQLEQLQGAL